jgi:hypothetical protein
LITREELYELVWSKPMTKVGEQFEVSGSYMARICDVLNVPRPERGYWAKLAVGKAPARRPLPEARPGDLVGVVRVLHRTFNLDSLPTIRKTELQAVK